MEPWILDALQSGPKIFERLLRVFPTDRIDERVDKDRFTAREVISHLADYERTVLERISIAHATPGTTVPAFDPDKHCIEHKYAEKNVFHEAEVFESRRLMTIEHLIDLSEKQLNSTFKFADGREISIRNYMILIMSHDVNHLEQVSRYLATEVATII